MLGGFQGMNSFGFTANCPANADGERGKVRVMQDIFGKIPGMRNPPAIASEAYRQLRRLALG
jgi:hypothetical protein